MIETASALGLEQVDCPVCGPAPRRLWMDDGKPTRYLRCQQCGTIFASPRLGRAARAAQLDDSFRPGEAAEQNEASRRRALEQEANLIHRHLAGGRLLDVGCDLGAFFESFPEPAWQRYGVEVSPAAAEYAAHQHRVDVFAGTIHQAGYPALSFDIVTMMDMFYYVDEPRAVLCEAVRVLKPGGLLVLEVPGVEWTVVRNRGLMCLLLDGRWSRLQTDSAYLYFYSLSGLHSLLENSGFAALTTYVIGSPESPTRWRNLLAGAHAGLVRAAVRLNPDLFNWAPKYLLLARRCEAAS